MSGKQHKVKKLTTFYGTHVARPYVVLKDDGQVDKDRVDAPKINDALIAWASQVPFGQGGTMVKPAYDSAEGVQEARTDFQIFLTERYTEILAANPGLLVDSDRKTLLAVASTFWRDKLSPEERKAFHEKAIEEKKAVEGSIAVREAADPKFQAFRQKMKQYKHSVGNILSAAKAQTAPMWKLQRRANSQYKKLRAAEGKEEVEVEGQPEEQEEKEHHQAKPAQKKAGKKGKKKAVEESEEEEQEGLLSGKRKAAGKKARGSGSKPATAEQSKAAAGPSRKRKGYEKLEEEEEDNAQEQQQPAPKQQQKQQQKQQRGSSKTEEGEKEEGSGAAQLSKKLTKKRGSQLYEGEYELPPSQNPSPSKAEPADKKGPKSAGKQGKEQAAAGAAPVSAQKGSGGSTRSRRKGEASAGARQAKPSPAKKLRSSERLRG